MNGEAGRRQAAVARTLTWLADQRDLRCVVGLGDNIYGGDEDRLEQSGDEDDDWFFTFYEPYRHVIDRLPFYPAAGNHDGPDEEDNDDRAQLEDNFHLRARFAPRQEHGRASLDPGLFYQLRLGALVELICVDTSWGGERGRHWFDDEHHLALAHRHARPTRPAPRWRIPFSHHPPWCAGPKHPGMPEQVDRLVPLYRDGRRAADAARPRAQPAARPRRRDRLRRSRGPAASSTIDRRATSSAAGTRSWAAEPHCLLVEVTATG